MADAQKMLVPFTGAQSFEKWASFPGERIDIWHYIWGGVVGEQPLGLRVPLCLVFRNSPKFLHWDFSGENVNAENLFDIFTQEKNRKLLIY